MKDASRKFIDLIEGATSKLANWDPSTPIAVGSYGMIDKETGQFQQEGNIYDQDCSVDFDRHDEALKPQVQEYGDDEFIVKSWGVTAKTAGASPASEVNAAGIENVVLKVDLEFDSNKRAAVLIMYKPRYTILPNNERITRLLNTRPDVLKGKHIVTQVISCSAYMMYLSDTTKESFSVTLKANGPIMPGVNVEGTVGLEWASEGFSGIFRKGSDPKIKYVPLYRLQKPSFKFWERTFGRNFQPSVAVLERQCNVKLAQMLWEDALLDAEKVIELDPSSGLGYQLKYAALHGAERYDEAIVAFEMLSKLNDGSNMQIQSKPQINHSLNRGMPVYLPSEAARAVIQKVIDTEMESAPSRLFDTSTGLLCDRGAQIGAFKASMEYKKLLSEMLNDVNHPMEHIRGVVVMFFRYVMLSHRWEGKELLLDGIQDRSVYGLDPVDGIAKVQSFCKVVRGARFRWAWSDTCCINKNNIIELQQSVNSMFVWYRHSALTIVYLSDVLPSSKSGALAMSDWNSRGWTVQEFLAPKVVLFYQKDWTLYLDDRSSNHKESAAIMRELEDRTGINRRALIAFHPGMRGAREKLTWASMRVTTLPEDIAYSLFGIFRVHLPPIYGENKQNALGRLLREIIAQSGDITCLDWVGKSSEFNSYLPASITSYGTPPSTLSSPLSEDKIQTLVSSLREGVDEESASKLYHKFNSLSIPKFAARRLHLPCIAFVVTEIKRPGTDKQSFIVKANGLQDVSITTEDKIPTLLPSRAKQTRQNFLLARPWDRSLLELPDFEDLSDTSDTESIEDRDSYISPPHDLPVDSLGESGPADFEFYPRVLRSIAHLQQPFSVFLLAKQRGGEYKRIASDQEIIAKVRDMASIDVRTVDIL